MIHDLRSKIYAQLMALALIGVGWHTNTRAQVLTPDEFFHGGAQLYLTNNVPGALEVVTNGLQQFPDDEKLKKLYELLKQQQQSQDNQQQQDQDQQEKKDDPKQNQNKKDQKDQQQKNNQEKPPEKKQDQDNKPHRPKSGDKKDQKPEQTQGRSAPMTPQQAQRLLDSQKGSEQVLWFKPEGKPEDPSKPHKDW